MPNKSPNKSWQDVCIVIEQEEKPAYVALKIDGEIQHFKLKRATWDDHVKMHGK